MSERTVEEREAFSPLTDEEKSRMRDVLRFHMRANPIPKSGFERFFKVGNTGFTLFNLVYLNYRFIPVGAAAFAIMLIVSLGSFAASEGTLPGDTLYPLKQKGEGVRSAFTFYPDAEALWQLERTERRLNELELLTREGKLNASYSAQITEEIGKSLGVIENSIGAFNRTHFNAFPIPVHTKMTESAAEEGQYAILLYGEVSAIVEAKRSILQLDELRIIEREEELANRMIIVGNRLLSEGLETEAYSAYAQATVVLVNLKAILEQ